MVAALLSTLAVPRAVSVWPSNTSGWVFEVNRLTTNFAVMSRATFPAAARMHRPTEFAAALSGKRIARGAYFIVTANPASVSASASSMNISGVEPQQSASDEAISERPIARLGLIMAKRLAHHASTRNALKRVVREAFRAQRFQLPAADYVVRLHKRIQDISLTQLKLAARLEADAHFSRVRS